MTINFPTADTLAEKMVENLTQGATKSIDDLPNQWIIKTLLLATRDVTYDAVVAAKTSYEDRDIYLSTGDALDRLCVEKTPDVRRKQELKAVLKVRLTKAFPAASDIVIPKESFVTSPQMGDIPAMDFYLLEEYVLPKGEKEIEVLIECSVAGIIGNLTSRSIVGVLHPGMTGIEGAEILELVKEGADKESDTSLRARLLESLEYQEKGGTEPDYEIWAKQVPGVITAKSIPLARGNGTLDLIIVGANGLPSESLISQVQNYIDGKVPAGGCSVLVKAPIPIYINVELDVTLQNGADMEKVTPLLQEKLILTIANENNVLIVRKRKIGEAAGQLEDIFNYSLKAPAEDIKLDQGELAILGTLQLNEVIL
ncbi:baseplate J/gp47 family protein [Bacillus infantis]|uniref:baseplate J/gp47 family protein n=1 Tax=Bacillus infantis TaxID=324767 RepID=UPI002FBE8D86